VGLGGAARRGVAVPETVWGGGGGGGVAERGRRTGVGKDEDGHDLPKFDSFDGSVVGVVDFSRV